MSNYDRGTTELDGEAYPVRTGKPPADEATGPDPADTEGGQKPEDVEDRPKVGTVTPEDYPKELPDH